VSDQLEFVERKGIGHPDSVADIIAEEMMLRYRRYVYSKIGIMPNGWFDKVVVSGGEAHVTFGHAEIIKKPKIILYGKAMKIDGNADYIYNLFSSAVEYVIDYIFGHGVFDNIEVEVAVNSGMGAEHAKGFYDLRTNSKLNPYFLKDVQKANDTIITSGWWPLNVAEKSVIIIENYINSEYFKNLYPETGYDVKVVTTCINSKYEFTICIPFIASITPTKIIYEKKKQQIVSLLQKYIYQELLIDDFSINLNTKDDEHSAYLTVFGSAFDKGDVGVTGRGNRYPGVISIMRPSGVEAYAGKNTFNHSGKLYAFLATDLAKTIQEFSNQDTQVIISTDNGIPIDEPKNIVIILNEVLADNSLFSNQINKSIDRLKSLSSKLEHRDTIESFRSCHGFFK